MHAYVKENSDSYSPVMVTEPKLSDNCVLETKQNQNHNKASMNFFI